MVIKHDKLFSYYIKSTFLGVISLTFILVIISIMSVLQPLVSKKIVDAISSANTEANIQLLIQMSFVYVAIGLIISILSYFKNISMEKIYKYATRKSRTDLLETVSNFKYEKINSFDKGFLYSRIYNSTEKMSMLFSLTIPTILSNILFLVLVVLVVAAESRIFALIMIVIIISSLFVISFLIFYGRSFLSKSNRNALKRHGQYIETLNGIKYIKMHRMIEHLLIKLEKISRKEYSFAMKTVVINSSVNSFITLGENITVALIIIFGLRNVDATSSFTIAQIYLLITYIRKVFEPIYVIVDEFDKMQKSISSYIGINRMLNQDSDLNGEKKLKTFKEKIEKIEFSNVSYSFTKEVDSLKNVSFKIRAGEKVALIGEVGKHSIIDLILKLILPKNGQIKINDMPLKKYSSSSIREKITVIEQDPSIFKGTLLDNIVLYEKSPNMEKVEKIMKETKLSKYLNKNSQIQEDGKNLSTGEKELISLARVMYKGGEIFIWHETISMLDLEIQKIIYKIIEKLAEDKTLIIVAHRPSTIETCDRILNVKENGVSEIKVQNIQ